VGTDSARELTDEVLAEEIELLGEVVLAGSGAARHLTQEEVDDVLHLDGPDPRAETPSDAASTTSDATAGSPPAPARSP
jgi:hypothetical protein